MNNTPKVGQAMGNIERGFAVMRAGGGFTIIELLVIIAVLSSLLAILLPVLTKARVNARRVACKSNLRQIASAWHLYLDDNDGQFYQGLNANLAYGGWRGMMQGPRGWPRPLNPYMGFSDPNAIREKTARIFCCPADFGGMPGNLVNEKVYHVVGTSYQTNVFLVGQTQTQMDDDLFKTLEEEMNKRLKVMKLTDAYNPTKLVLIGDYGWINQWKPVPHPRVDWKKLAEWHGHCCHHNLACLDGHVEFVHVRKGLYVTPDYSVLPFRDLARLAYQSQKVQICSTCGF